MSGDTRKLGRNKFFRCCFSNKKQEAKTLGTLGTELKIGVLPNFLRDYQTGSTVAKVL